jgi:N6-L-threonylcarbamoyladenine synthase/protein kinase Bud32
MCTEVAERALSQTGKEELILVGGVGMNKRFQEMLSCMCEDRALRSLYQAPNILVTTVR